MPHLISRIIASRYTPLELNPKNQVTGSSELIHLINGTSSFQESVSHIISIYERLPSPKLYGITQALLSIPLKNPLSLYLLTEAVILILKRNGINLLFDQIRSKIYPMGNEKQLEPETKEIADLLLDLAYGNSIPFHELMTIAHREKEAPAEALFQFFLETRADKPSLSHFAFTHRHLCAWDAEDLLIKQLSGVLLKRWQLQVENDKWREIRQQFHTRSIDDLFLNRLQIKLQGEHLSKLLSHFIDLKLPERYPASWDGWIKTLRNGLKPLIDKLLSTQSYLPLIPFLKKDAQVRNSVLLLPIPERIAFCASCLPLVSADTAAPFLRDLLNAPLTLDQLDQICEMNFHLMPLFLKKALDLTNEPIEIYLSEAQKKILSQAPEMISFSIVNHIRLTDRSKNELLKFLLPHIPKQKIAIWYDLLDPAADAASLPFLFLEERKKRQLALLMEKCRTFHEPNEAIVQEALEQSDEAFALIVNAVLKNGSPELITWLIGHCPISKEEHYLRLLSPLLDDPQSRPFIEMWCQQVSSAKELLSVVGKHKEVSTLPLKLICRRLEQLPLDKSASPVLIRLSLHASLDQFPWRHWLHLLRDCPDAAASIHKDLIDKILKADQLPLIFQDEFRQLTAAPLKPSQILNLIAFAAELPLKYRTGYCHLLFNLLENISPQEIKNIKNSHRTLYLETALKPDMSPETSKWISLFLQTSSSFITHRFAHSFFLICIDRFFGSEQFDVWARELIYRFENDWKSFPIYHHFDSKNLTIIPLAKNQGVIKIETDPDKILSKIIHELLTSSSDLEPHVRGRIQESCRTIPKLKINSLLPFELTLSLKTHSELIYYFVETLSAYQPISGFTNCFKNLFCRTMIRELLIHDPHAPIDRLRKISIDLYLSVKRPLQTLRLIETRGFWHLSTQLTKRIRSSNADEYLIAFESVNILTCGKINNLDRDFYYQLAPLAIRQSMDAFYYANSLNWNLMAQDALENLSQYLTTEEYSSYKEGFQSQQLLLLPRSLEDQVTCSFLIAAKPSLLFSAVKYWTKGSQSFKENVLSNARLSYAALLEKRTELSLREKLSHLKKDAVLLLFYKKMAQALHREKEADELCEIWIDQLAELLPTEDSLTAEEAKESAEVNDSIFLLFKVYSSYFKRDANAFIKMWFRSRSIVTERLKPIIENKKSVLEMLYAHNLKTRELFPIVRRHFPTFLLLLECESILFKNCKFSLQDRREIQKRYLQDLFPVESKGSAECIQKFIHLNIFIE